MTDAPMPTSLACPICGLQQTVGKVAQTELIPDGTAVAISVRIDEAHTDLVRERSVFWNASGIHTNLSLLDPSIDVESAKALIGGGIAFATPAAGGEAPSLLLHRRNTMPFHSTYPTLSEITGLLAEPDQVALQKGSQTEAIVHQLVPDAVPKLFDDPLEQFAAVLAGDVLVSIPTRRSPTTCCTNSPAPAFRSARVSAARARTWSRSQFAPMRPTCCAGWTPFSKSS